MTIIGSWVVQGGVRRLVAVVMIWMLLLAGGCGDETPTAVAPPAREVEAIQLRTVDLPVSFEFVGRTASSQRVEIRSRVSGFLEAIDYREGGYVEEGDVLFRIDPAPFEARLRAARAELSQQQARLDNAEALLARVQPLAEVEAVAQKELDDANGRVNEARAAVEAAAARVFESELDLGYATIKAPVSGMTGQSAERVGAYLGLGAAPLTYVARIDPIWVEFSVSEAQALTNERRKASGELSVPEDDALEVEVIRSDGVVHPSRGRISFADASVDAQTGTILVRAEIPNDNEPALHPGQFVQVVIHGVTRPGALLVPKPAVQQGAQGAYVWVINSENKAEQRPVTTGLWEGEDWVIRSGLKAGERVITSGLVGLQPGTPVSIVSLSEGASASVGQPR